MNRYRHLIVVFLMLSISLAYISKAHAEIAEGKDYTVLANPQPVQDASKIEVIEFFWYGCPHCYNLHPHLKDWLKNISSDVNFRYVPAIFRANWVPATKLFYAIDAIGATDHLHDKAYDAIHRDKIDLNAESVLFDWIEKQGVEKKKFENAYSSFGVQNQVSKSTQMSRQYQLTGVPALVVDGKYLTSAKMGGTPQDTIKVLDALIEKVRKERGQ